MLVLFFFVCLFAPICMVSCKFTTIEEIKNTFGSKNCIEGSLSSLPTTSTETFLLAEDLNNRSTYLGNVSSSEIKHEKSPTSKLHELAQYNDIKYFYKLEKDEGPPHNRLFTLSLTLGDEKYVSEATSLKKAQHNLAIIALKNTDYEPPPFKEKEQNTETLTPTVLLNNLGAKLGLPITYYLVDKKSILNTNRLSDGKQKKSYLQKLNDSAYSDNDIHVRRDEPQSKGPFHVMVEVGEESFYGTSYTVQSARHEAAAKAVDHLIKKVQEGDSVCIKEDSKECKQARASLKSPISLVHEAAQLRNMDIKFEIIKEEGPSHSKVFTTQCQLGHLTTTGEGKSKKESKRLASVNMLDRISELPEVPQEVLVGSLLKEKKKNKKKKKKIVKTQFDMINMHVENFMESIMEAVPISDAKSETSTKNTDISKSSKQKPSGKSYQDKILEISNLLNFEVQFTDIDDKDEHFSIMSLHVNPDHICLGRGPSIKSARNKAAKEGLKLLQDIPLDTYLKNKKHTVLESEVKEKIHSLLNQDVSEDK